MNNIEVALNILGITGGVVTGLGIILFALFKFLGTIQINRINNTELHELSLKLEANKTELATSLTKIQHDLSIQAEKQNLAFNLFFSGQHKTYSELCNSIVDIEAAVDLLWEGVDRKRFSSFVNSIKTAKINIRKAKPYIENEDYRLILSFFDKIEKYRDGKEKVLEFESLSDEVFNRPETLRAVNRFVSENSNLRDEIHHIADIFLDKLAARLRS